MGLDVYLGRCANLEAATEQESLFEKAQDEIWEQYPEYDQMTDGQKDEARAKVDALREKMGLVDWGSSPDKVKVKKESEIHPGHLFKVGYFRSSYNSGGINSVFRDYAIPDLYDIFNPGNEYYVRPDWSECLKRCKNAIELLKNGIENNPKFKFVVIEVSKYKDPEIDSESTALDAFIENLEQHEGSDFRAYSGRDGLFYLDGLKVYAVINGRNRFGECTYVITDRDFSWYVQALEIVQETIEYVLAQEHPEHYYLCWSS